jgi:hypothetical protein
MGLAVLLNLTAIAWVATTTSSRRAADAGQPRAGPSVATSRPSDGVTTTTGAVTTTVAQAAGDGPRNLLANASFESGWQRRPSG